MKTKTQVKTKEVYFPPTVNSIRVFLEESIALSPVQDIEMNDWTNDSTSQSYTGSDGDVWLNN